MDGWGEATWRDFFLMELGVVVCVVGLELCCVVGLEVCGVVGVGSLSRWRCCLARWLHAIGRHDDGGQLKAVRQRVLGGNSPMSSEGEGGGKRRGATAVLVQRKGSRTVRAVQQCHSAPEAKLQMCSDQYGRKCDSADK